MWKSIVSLSRTTHRMVAVFQRVLSPSNLSNFPIFHLTLNRGHPRVSMPRNMWISQLSVWHPPSRSRLPSLNIWSPSDTAISRSTVWRQKQAVIQNTSISRFPFGTKWKKKLFLGIWEYIYIHVHVYRLCTTNETALPSGHKEFRVSSSFQSSFNQRQQDLPKMPCHGC